MKYFIEIKTLEDLKKEYKKQVLKLHPDINKETDTTREFIEMQEEYELVFNRVKNNRINSQGEYYEAETNETPEEFKNIIDKIIFFSGCNIDIIGTWIWVSGNTYNYKDELKKLNFKWCKNKNAWSFHNGEYHKRSKKQFSLEDLKNKFDTTSIKTHQMSLLEV